MMFQLSTTRLRHTGPRVIAARMGVVRLGAWDIRDFIDDVRDSGIRRYAEHMRRRREH